MKNVKYCFTEKEDLIISIFTHDHDQLFEYGRIIYLRFTKITWWWRFGCKDACTLLSKNRLGWLIGVRSMHEDEVGKPISGLHNL